MEVKEENLSSLDEWESISRLVAPEGNVEKFVFTKKNAVAEAVLYQYPSYSDRTVICCSTQSGCPVGCRFCGAGDYFVRSLTTDEIISQPKYLLDLVEAEEGVPANSMEKLQIMFMSMGEPLLNLKRLLEALPPLHELYPKAALLVSTSGPRVDYEPFIKSAREISTLGLQFSVHESTDEARNALIPFKNKLTLAEIAKVGEEFYTHTGRSPFFNYCVHEGNNTAEDVARLVKLFAPDVWSATVSVICERDETMKAAHERQEELTNNFMGRLLTEGYNVRRFNPEGQDSIGGGCGQLKYVQRWFEENPDSARKSVGFGLPILHADGRSLLNLGER